MDRVIPRSTAWARAHKDIVAARDSAKRKTLYGKLLNLATQSRYRATKSGLDHTIDTKYLQGLWDGQNGCCAISGRPMSIFGPRGSDDYWNSVSIDRINSDLGYT